MLVAAAAALTAVFLVVYVPDAGHGFISDDFRWIVESRVHSPSDIVGLFGANIGFYRPVVFLTFAADHALWGTNPSGYGLTNLGLCLAVAAMVFTGARRLGLPAAAALAAAGVWLFNFHAVNMAVLWLSGRTALLVSLFSLATAHAFLGGRWVISGLFCLLAMLSKEEAVALPALFTTFHLLGERSVGHISRTLPLWTALVVYLVLRLNSGAFGPTDAPPYYQLSFSPVSIGRNVLEYADRAGTVTAVAAIVLIAVTRVRRAHLANEERRALVFAGLWIVATYALTVLLPVRSSLYALLPSSGSALAFGAIASAAARLQPLRFQRVAVGLIVAAALLIPVYRARNVRWVRLAEVSEQAMRTIGEDAEGRSSGHVVLIDDPAERFNLASAFGALFPEAMRLRVGDGWTGEVVSTTEDARRGDLTYRLSNGVLERTR